MKKLVFICLLVVIFSALWIACSENKNPLPSRTHPQSWTQESAADFHGKKVLAVGTSSCTACHGTDLSGGESNVSCTSCHDYYPHKKQWTEISTAGFHGEFIRGEKWSMAKCQKCHGADYRGGETGVSCYKCHTEDGGPEACNVCHGSKDNFAPPKDLSNHIDKTAMGVGAHQLHMSLFKSCALCHVVPSTVADAGHIDDTPYAEVLASWGWDRNSATCANACHSDTSKTYIWNNF